MPEDWLGVLDGEEAVNLFYPEQDRVREQQSILRE